MHASSTLPSWLIAALTALFLVVWLLPPLDFLKQGVTVFPVWMHTVAELVAVAVALLVFAVCWHTDAGERSGNALIIGCGFLAVGLVDVAHLLSYRGMPDFVTAAHTEKAINFWLAARYLAAFTLLAVAWRDWPAVVGRRSRYTVLGVAIALSALVGWLQLFHPTLWPRTFEDGRGLTAFKIGAEYGLIVLMSVAAIGFQRRMVRERSYDALDLRTAAVITILGELCFTLYSNVNDVFQLLGHAYKIVAYLYIYRAVFVAGVREPYARLRVEIEERRQAEQRIEFLAFHDPLTELPNRVLARDRVERAIAAAARGRARMALLYLDLDHFKTVNDSLGHGAGDRLLKTVALRLRATLRETDSICRQGGDEFLIVLGDCPTRQRWKPVIDKLMAALVQPMRIDGQELTTTASIGVALLPRRRHRLRHPAAEGRHGAVPRQGRRPQRLPLLRRADERAGDGPPAAAQRPAPGAGAGRVRAALPAAGRPAQRRSDRCRGAAALEPRRAPAWCRRAASSRMAEETRPDRADRRLGARRGLPPGDGLAARGLPAMTVAVNLSALQFGRGTSSRWWPGRCATAG